MKIRSIVIGALFACASLHAATVATTGDLLFVTGSGSNLSTLVIDFNDGSANDSFAWGFRWDGEASGADMILAIAAADSNITITSFGDGDSGFYLTQISYFDGTTTHSATSGNFATYPADYVSWSYYLSGGLAGGSAVAGGGSSLPSSWTNSSVGAAADSFGSPGRFLTDGSWDAWSFGQHAEDFSHTAPPSGTTLAAVPEPATALLAGIAVLGLGLRRRRA